MTLRVSKRFRVFRALPRTAIRESVRKADLMLVLWSDQAAKSAWVYYEIGMAQALGVPIRVLMADGTRAKLPPGLTESEPIEAGRSKY